MASDPVTSKPPSLASRVSNAVFWNTLFVPVRMIAEVVTNLLKLNILSPASFGLLALISNTNNGAGTAIDLGTSRALPKYIPETMQAGGTRAVLRLLTIVFAAQMALLLLFSGGLIVMSGPYLGFLQDQVTNDTRLDSSAQTAALDFLTNHSVLIIVAVVVLLFLGVCYDMLMAYLASFFRQRAWNSIDLAARLLPPLLSAAALLAGWDILGVLLAMLIAPTLVVISGLWRVVALWREEDRVRPEAAGGTREPVSLRAALPAGFVRYSGVSFLMTITDFVAGAGFAIFLAQDVSDVALLWAGTSLVRMALSYLYTPMVGVQVPLFTRVRAGEGGTVNGAYQSLVRLQVLLMVPGGVGLVLLTAPALKVLSPQYLDAAPIVWVLVPCLFLECLLTTAHNALIVHEKLGIIIMSRLLTLIVIVPMALWLPPILGITGVALAFGSARVAAGFWATASGYRLLGLRWPWNFTLRVSLATGAMGAGLLLMRDWLPIPADDATIATRLWLGLWVLAVVVAGAALFAVVLRLTGGLDPQDRRQLEQTRLPLKRWLLRVL
ncbi:lipopolysaccharide biosynthesis protein [Candidatus Chloroploca asiatica]|uniref:Uncharacterized protein n=1 Tax=Candidatus Chloroploca asiatica TaxID=1506545 RepID=A0A2H3KX23_9CHLR|nr:polysaccharide biosynthesis C-terminal domain-containing protein [Candidatus Chloroploca asiatica]PDV96921.1 hypothetical protein A9Q02_19760 [Candidatus Chloroploca asiatica]